TSLTQPATAASVTSEPGTPDWLEPVRHVIAAHPEVATAEVTLEPDTSGVAHRIEAVLEADAEVVRAAVVYGHRGGVRHLVGFVQRSLGAGEADDPRAADSAEERAEQDSAFHDRVRGALSPVLSARGGESVPVISIATVPLDPQGEPDRAALAHRADGFLASLAVLTGIWSEVLRTPDIDEAGSFLGHGGDSLAAMRAANRIRDRLGVRLPMSVLLSARTVSDVAAHIAAQTLDIQEGGHA
ncbi:acyl carrier protein, partial [Rugosimonospora acidiphila]|uniref:acyl carrier protein n=1 Tax=Rugosimonospora acidiphila TaxID=556531 RepID=UPI0031EEFA93